MKPAKQRPRKEREAEARDIAAFNEQLGSVLGLAGEIAREFPEAFVPEDPFVTKPIDDEEVGRCSCGAVFYSMDAAHDHECPLESEAQ